MTSIREIPILPVSDQVQQAREKWQYRGDHRPDFADIPAPGQESVWDFPRPPVMQPVSAVLRVFNGHQLIAETQRGLRVLETAGAPTYYFPPEDVEQNLLEYAEMSSICEWKGVAQNVHVDGITNAGWRYTRMFKEFSTLHQWLSFYPNRLLCFVDTEQAQAQPGGYYGGWVTKNLAGPIKGTPESAAW